MDLYQVATQVGSALAPVLPRLRVYPYGTKDIAAPAAVFALPASIDYHQSYGTGGSKISDASVLVMLRDTTRRSAFQALAGYVKPTGTGSIKAALEGYASYTACDTVTVTSVDFDMITMGAVDYYAALFHLDIFGSGT